MARELIDLFNSTFSPKIIWEGEVQHVLPPHAVIAFEPAVAQKFLAEYPGLVQEYVIPDIPDVPGHRRVWIANGTGNPHLPQTIFIPSPKEHEAPFEIPHPNREPVSLSWSIRQAEQVERSGDSQQSNSAFNIPGITLTLPPFERVSVPEPTANMLIQRDGLQPPWRQGKVLRARDPAAFEPNRTWALNDLILYGRLMDEAYFTQKRIMEEFPSEEKLLGDKKKIREVRIEVWRALFFRLIDRNYGRPPKDAFEAAKAKVKAEIAAAATPGTKR